MRSWLVMMIVIGATSTARAGDAELVAGTWRSDSGRVFVVKVSGNRISVRVTSPQPIDYKDAMWVSGMVGGQFTYGEPARCTATLNAGDTNKMRVVCKDGPNNWRRISAPPAPQKFRCPSGKYYAMSNRCESPSYFYDLRRKQPNTNYPSVLKCPPGFEYRGAKSDGRSPISCYACSGERYWDKRLGRCLKHFECKHGAEVLAGACK